MAMKKGWGLAIERSSGEILAYGKIDELEEYAASVTGRVEVITSAADLEFAFSPDEMGAIAKVHSVRVSKVPDEELAEYLWGLLETARLKESKRSFIQGSTRVSTGGNQTVVKMRRNRRPNTMIPRDAILRDTGKWTSTRASQRRTILECAGSGKSLEDMLFELDGAVEVRSGYADEKLLRKLIKDNVTGGYLEIADE